MTPLKTVESPEGLPWLAEVVKHVKAGNVAISKEGRGARVKNARSELVQLEIELHSATHIPFRDWCSACVASRPKEDPHWRMRTEDAQEKGHDAELERQHDEQAPLSWFRGRFWPMRT